MGGLASFTLFKHYTLLVLGDLNNVSSVEDRIGDKLINLAKCVTYHNCVEACSLIELKWVVQ